MPPSEKWYPAPVPWCVCSHAGWVHTKGKKRACSICACFSWTLDTPPTQKDLINREVMDAAREGRKSHRKRIPSIYTYGAGGGGGSSAQPAAPAVEVREVRQGDPPIQGHGAGDGPDDAGPALGLHARPLSQEGGGGGEGPPVEA